MRLHHDREGKLVISVQDNGVGLPAERDRIIEPYMTTRQKGTGLGLAIVKKIVEEHFGEIAFEDATGGGTCVRITLDSDMLEKLDHDSPDHKTTKRGWQTGREDVTQGQSVHVSVKQERR